MWMLALALLASLGLAQTAGAAKPPSPGTGGLAHRSVTVVVRSAPLDSAAEARAAKAGEITSLRLIDERIGRSTHPQAKLYVDKGDILRGLQRWRDAILAYRKAKAIEPELSEADLEARVYSGLADAAFHLGETGQAEEQFERLRASGKIRWMDWGDEARRQESLGKIAIAARDWSAAAQIRKREGPGRDGAYFTWMRAVADYEKSGSQRAAAGAARRCIAAVPSSVHLSPEAAACHLALAGYEAKFADFESMLKDSSAAAALAPKIPAPRYLEAVADARLHRNRAGIEAAKAALGCDGVNRPMVYMLLGVLYSQSGDWSRAAASFRELATLSPRNPRAAYLTGMAYLHLGNGAAARRWLDQALANGPDRSLHAEIEFALGQLRKAP